MRAASPGDSWIDRPGPHFSECSIHLWFVEFHYVSCGIDTFWSASGSPVLPMLSFLSPSLLLSPHLCPPLYSSPFIPPPLPSPPLHFPPLLSLPLPSPPLLFSPPLLSSPPLPSPPPLTSPPHLLYNNQDFSSMESHLRLYRSSFLFFLSFSLPLPLLLSLILPTFSPSCLTFCLSFFLFLLSHLLSVFLSLPTVFSPVAMLRVWKVPVPSERCSMSCRALVAGTAPQKVSQFNLELLLLSPFSVPPPLLLIFL